MRPDLVRVCFYFSSPWEYKQHLLSTYLPNVSSLIVSRDVLAGFFVTTGKKVSIMTTTNVFTIYFLELVRKKIKASCKVPAKVILPLRKFSIGNSTCQRYTRLKMCSHTLKFLITYV